MINYVYGTVPFRANLANSGSKSMTVNGATTPVVFSYSPGAGVSSEIHKISCILKQSSGDNTAFTNFAAGSALTNGVLIQCTVNGTATTMCTLKDNSDLCNMFSVNQFGSGAILSILSVVTPEGFGGTNNCFVGVMEFLQPFILTGSDTLTVTVQDNLSSVGLLNMSVAGVILVPGA
jgi:hypothetical protein